MKYEGVTVYYKDADNQTKEKPDGANICTYYDENDISDGIVQPQQQAQIKPGKK